MTWTHHDGRARMPQLLLEREHAQLDAETLGYHIGFAGALATLDKALARIYLLEHALRGQGADERRVAAQLHPRSGNVENVVPLRHKPVCDFCHGQPVQDAASWADGKPRPPAPCPRCGETAA